MSRHTGGGFLLLTDNSCPVVLPQTRTFVKKNGGGIMQVCTVASVNDMKILRCGLHSSYITPNVLLTSGTMLWTYCENTL